MNADARRDTARTDDESPVDWYAVLGVTPEAEPDAIRDAWRALARMWHPDAQPSAPDAGHRFHLIQSAWHVLGDPERRRAWDRDRARFAERVAPLPRGFVERLVGVRRPEPDTGRNRIYRLTVSVAEVVTGTRRAITVPAETTCGDCGGGGLGAFGRPRLCPVCGGRCFEVTRPVLRAIGEPCGRCDAAGWVPEPPCARCGGTGRVAGEVVLDVAVPAGIGDGWSVTFAGLGEPGRGGAASGDLDVIVQVDRSGPWRLQGDDWYGEVVVPFWRAVAGGRVAVATPLGPRVVHLPENTRSGERLCLPGLGVNMRGDGFLTVALAWPVDLDDAEKAALVAWGENVESRRTGAEGGEDA